MCTLVASLSELLMGISTCFYCKTPLYVCDSLFRAAAIIIVRKFPLYLRYFIVCLYASSVINISSAVKHGSDLGDGGPTAGVEGTVQ